MDVQWRQGVCGAVLALMLTACGSGSSSGSSDQVNQNPPPPPAPVTSPELSNLAPAALSFDLEAGQSDTATITFRNSGDAALTYELASTASWLGLPSNAGGSVAAGGSASLVVTATCGSVNLSGTLTLTTNDADEGTNTVQANAVCTVPPVNNYAVARVLMNQGARAFDSDVSDTPGIDLLSGRDLLVRAFVTGSGSVPNARVVMSRPGQSDATYTMQSPASVGANPPTDTLLNASHYVVVPGAAVHADSSLRVEVAPFANPATYPETGDIALNAVEPGSFDVTFVPVTFDGQTPSIDINAYMRQVLQVLPIGEMNVQVRTPYVFTEAYDLDTLLTEIADLRDQDGSSRLYHGIIIPPGGSGSQTAGIAYVGFPVGVSIDLGGAFYVIAHEMGHNLNLGHAPGCDSPNPDPDFPNAEGEVTTWGFDTTTDTLVEPTVTKRDFMSYCNDLWVSDYHFDRAIDYRDQSPRGFAPTADRGLTLSGQLRAGAVSDVRMVPTDHLRLPYLSDAADYRLRAWDAAGQTLVDQSFETHMIEDLSEGAVEAFSVNVPYPSAPIHHYEISRAGQVLHTETVAAPAAALPSAVAVDWQDGRAVLDWAPQSGQTLIVRNAAGEVVAMDRSGAVSLSGSDGLQASLSTHGRITATADLQMGRPLRFERVQ